MKKLFTLLVSVLMAGSAFGQTNWTNKIVNGDFESETYDFESARSHEWLGEMTEATDGYPRIVADADNPSNHIATIYVRSREEAYAAGNYTKDYTGADGTYASWDTQFFIVATEPIPTGKEVRLLMKVKGNKDGYFESQAHSAPGTYIDQSLFGNINYTTEWTDYKSDVIVVSSTQGDGGFQTVAFNLSTTDDNNEIFFDDIKLQIRDPKEIGDDESAWINFMRKGIYSDDHITGTSSEGDWECSNFTIQTPEQTKAPVVEVPGEPGVMAVHVPVRSYYIEQVEDLDEDGNQQFDDDGNVKMKSVYYWNDGTEAGTSAPARWTCQFFVSTLHKMKTGEKYRFKFRVKADRPSALGTQAHTGPGKYVSYNTFGDESAFPIGIDWTTFELGEAQNQTIPSGANGCQTITFDCVPLEDEKDSCQPNNFYFIFEECSFTEANVTIGDRTLGTPEDIQLPVNIDDEEKATTIDASPMLNTFEVEDFSFLNNGKDGIKLYMLVEPDDPEDDPIETFGSMLTWTDGGFVNAAGNFIDDDQGVMIRFDDESIDGTNININVWNNPDAGISFADGKTIQTRLAVSQQGWYYIYNITLGTEETLAGIPSVKVVKAQNDFIYNLAGQRVDASYKGLVIKNGIKIKQ
jgi:hypothetical protein